MERRAFIATLAGSVLAAPLAAEAQPASRVPRIGYLALDLTAGDPSPREAFLQGLRELGYVEGKNLLIENRDARGKPDRFPALAAELAALNVDLILAGGRHTRGDGRQAGDVDHPGRLFCGWRPRD